MKGLPWVHNDGGRAAAGWKALHVGDCVTRAVAITTGLPYSEVYDALKVGAQQERPRRGRTRSSVRNGCSRDTVRRYLETLGWSFVPTMGIGTGCRVHLREGELPAGRLIVSLSKHFAAVLDGVIHDTHDPSRDGERCVYGYYVKGGQ